MTDVSVTPDETARRTIRRSDWVPCKAAFIDCRTPGSDRKDNYSFIGVGVSQNSEQHINLEELHGFNLGAAGLPNGTTNSLHLHYTAEVFINFGGTFRVRWGTDGFDGEYVSTDGDVISVPTWIFRGFHNIGVDDGILLTVLGRDDTGGIIWGPSVLKEAEGHGLFLRADNTLVDTVAGQPKPDDDELIKPMDQMSIDELTTYSPEEMRGRITTVGDRRYSERPFLCSVLPGGRARLALVIGYGMTENRRQVPRLHEPHSFNLAWLSAPVGEGVLRHRHPQSQAVTVHSGRWEVTLNDGADERRVELGHQDTLSVPPGAWRSMRCVEAGPDGKGHLLVVNSSDARVELEWAPEVVAAAQEAGFALDPNHYLAPVAVLRQSTEDD
ncbi:cupin domain-containing protein [Agilicoccus flavus]|uniref:cupin domain-containing protein n=1 Tax=Agilicoccus flavus TaxID=2775968 RepID=UPI001CF69473|nr:cupin domain-containing protein [Agilicoccus flavus]